jgi:hypothetical protein
MCSSLRTPVHTHDVLPWGPPSTLGRTFNKKLEKNRMNTRFKKASNPGFAAPAAMNLLTTVIALTLTASAAFAQLPQPQGRLTLTSNTPVMTADVTSATSVYYTPYIGNQIPIYNGTNFVNNTFSQLTMMLNTTNQVSGCVYDLYVFLNSSTVTIGAGPAWESLSTCTTTTRGSTTGPTQLNGLWVNSASLTLTNGSSSYSSIPTDEATYVGSVYMTAAGETAMQFKPTAASGGTNNFLGVYNGYNRIPVKAYCRDSAGSAWTYNVATWRPADGASSNTNNRITYLDGLEQSFVAARYQTDIIANSTNSGRIGVTIDSTSATPGGSVSGPNTVGVAVPSIGQDFYYPMLGLHYVQAMEYAVNTTGAISFVGADLTGLGQDMLLTVEIDM